ncbi:hypothetical protein [uncultured Roseobacter sp.]|uniref:hypothetical protein n=1 Tax=uncultured Roseobacter sp. TaxID=114847 RepID=UPI002637F82A|nr:hypothetical protein [uncultured Roseobacter sp.]
MRAIEPTTAGLYAIKRATIFRNIYPDGLNGAESASERRRIGEMTLDLDISAARTLAHGFIIRYGEPDAMPPTPDSISFMVDTLSFRLGGVSRADAWSHIGIKPSRGRALLTRNHAAFNWPIWYTLLSAALE